MEYKVKELATLAGISSRTLRYYDSIGLLSPAKTDGSGYRIYGPEEVDKLQIILFYRELDLPLEEIKELIGQSDFDALETLKNHLHELQKKRKRLNRIIQSVNQTIQSKEENISMADEEKFVALKQELIEKNEARYGSEVVERYGQQSLQESNKQFNNLSKDQFKKAEILEQDILETLHRIMHQEKPEGKEARKLAEMHRQWIGFFWKSYSTEAHAGLVDMYVEDERFTRYYDGENHPGAAVFLRKAVLSYLGSK